MIEEIFKPNEHKKTSNLHRKTCKRCGVAFMGRPAALYCDNCRTEVRREYDRQYKHKSDKEKRKLGSIDKCLKCGKEYIVQSGKQKYCPACAVEAIRGNIRAERKKYMQEKREKSPALVKEWKRVKFETLICPICKEEFTPTDYRQKSCERCKDVLKKYRQYIKDCCRPRSNTKTILPIEDWLRKREEKKK